jgi:2-oxoglutarate dehydrogenase E1 component
VGTVRPQLSAALAISARSLSSSQAAGASPSPSPNDVFASGTNAYYAEEMYRRWRTDSTSVHASWDAYFSGLERGLPSSQAFEPPPGLIDVPTAADGAPALHVGSGGKELTDHLKVRILSHWVPLSSMLAPTS